MATHDRASAAPGAGRTAKRSGDPLPSVHSSESDRTYHLHRVIGKGGFGEVYLATPHPRGALPPQVCVKITDRLSPWLRESYFAELLYREPRALRVLDRFVVVDGARTRYCLVMEYARSEEHTSELQSRLHLVCRLLLEKKNTYHLRALPAISLTPHVRLGGTI